MGRNIIHIFNLNDYKWISKTLYIPKYNNKKILHHNVPGLSWRKIQKNLDNNKPILKEKDKNKIKTYIEHNIDRHSTILFNIGFADFLFPDLIPIANQKQISLITSSLNIIPTLSKKDDILIITYDRNLLEKYIYNTMEGKKKYLEYENINIIGFEDINKEFQEFSRKGFDISFDYLEYFFIQIIQHLKLFVNRDTHIIIECTAIMEIVPILKQIFKDNKIYGIHDI